MYLAQNEMLIIYDTIRDINYLQKLIVENSSRYLVWLSYPTD